MVYWYFSFRVTHNQISQIIISYTYIQNKCVALHLCCAVECFCCCCGESFLKRGQPCGYLVSAVDVSIAALYYSDYYYHTNMVLFQAAFLCTHIPVNYAC